MKIMGSNEFTDNTMSDPVSLDTGLAHNTVTKEVGYGNQIEETPISRGRRHELRAEGACGTVERPDQEVGLNSITECPRNRERYRVCLNFQLLLSVANFRYL